MKQMLLLVSACFLTLAIFGEVISAPFGDSTTSVSIRTHKWMDAENYYLGVIINGVGPEQIQVLAQDRSLSLRAQQEIHRQSNGAVSSSSGSANVSTSLPRDADITDLKKVITGNDLVIVIPRRR